MSSVPQPETPSLGLTTARQAVVAALSGAVVGYFIVATLEWRGVPVPVTPWSLPMIVGVLGVAGLVYATTLRRQVAAARGSLAPEAGVRALVLGKTLLMTGAVLGGGHAVYVGTFLGQFDAPLPRSRVVHGVATIVASLLCALAGYQLERACVVPPGDDLDELDGDDPAEQGSEPGQ